MICHVSELGTIDYRVAWEIQNKLARARVEGLTLDTLLLLEHPHTYTLGRSTRPEHLLLSKAECAQRGITVVEVDRGGDITYHGPGQLIAYPIRYLGPVTSIGRIAKANYVDYLRRLEDVIIRTLASFGVAARREEGLTGVWVDTQTGPEKIAAIGVHVNAQGISTHGLALNVTTDLSYFAGIVPCGIADRPVTSMQALLGENSPSMVVVIDSLKSAFAGVFECQLQSTELALTGF